MAYDSPARARDEAARLLELVKRKDATIVAQQRQIAALAERVETLETLRADLAVLKASIAELRGERTLTAAGRTAARPGK